jgi:UTP:GlnB (protein PII) uridylyltransferase
MNLKEAQAYMAQTGAMGRFKRYSQHINQAYFHRPHGIHGVTHTQRVLFLVELLAALENLAEPERDILSTAAVYHDIGRTNDGVDSIHGYSSYSKAEQLDLIQFENPEYYSTVKYLIETHCINDEEAFAMVRDYPLKEPDWAKNLLKFFKDADGLDRVRINALNPAMLRLSVSKELVSLAKELCFHYDDFNNR